MQITKRYWIHVGNRCNLKCKFCYYQDSLHQENNKTTTEIKKELRFIKYFWRKNRVDFTGGEPTIRSDLPDLIKYARKIGFKQGGIITNGLLLSNENYFKKLIEAGLDDVLFSIESPSAEKHDALTCVKGSFSKLINGIENAKKLNLGFRINITITKQNYKDLPELARFLLKFKPKVVNIISFNPVEDAEFHSEDMMASFSEVAPYIKQTINILKDHTKQINVRYIPFCFMKGYEKYICNKYQQKYDTYEADLILREWLWVGPFLTVYHILKGIIRLSLKQLLTQSLYSSFYDGILKSYQKFHRKSQECKKCNCNNICLGLTQKYAEVYGVKELKALSGKITLNPLEFRKNIKYP